MDKIQIAIIALVCIIGAIVIDNRMKISKLMEKRVKFEEQMPMYKELHTHKEEEENEDKIEEIED